VEGRDGDAGGILCKQDIKPSLMTSWLKCAERKRKGPGRVHRSIIQGRLNDLIDQSLTPVTSTAQHATSWVTFQKTIGFITLITRSNY
jgi:hypothetical protein